MSTGVAKIPGEAVAPGKSGLLSFSQIFQIGSVAALLFALFWSVLLDMAHDWWFEPALSQGLLLPPLALYMVWIHREKTYSIPAIPDMRGLLLTAFACFLFLVG